MFFFFFGWCWNSQLKMFLKYYYLEIIFILINNDDESVSYFFIWGILLMLGIIYIYNRQKNKKVNLVLRIHLL